MSEYASGRNNHPELTRTVTREKNGGHVTEQEALFSLDDLQPDTLVDSGLYDYSEARRLTEKAPVAAAEKPTPSAGVSVGLAERAIAVEQILTADARSNRARGGRRMLTVPGSEFSSRYPYPEDIVQGMESSAHRRQELAKRAFEQLTKREELLQAGFSAAEVYGAVESVQERRDYFAVPGRGNERTKEVRKTARTARRAFGNSK
ncbi:hypothetical protein CL689_05915 [Candidatus Saccharibacteria bacterium]|nr:hypothetical protein [Candidatus Saccharibacteria bacterium]MBJ58445.1 hypothetical protein [Candidatus Saccharibacteria bacterium]MBQ69576.1 hypothetical protein [Candidatus Saccharibacteria bacterium]|tara:strand:+ start:201 stop:815 length:615 start_codon:yes stop_codon:yes gene_type:complete